MYTTTFSVRMDSETQRQLDKVFSLYGLSGFPSNSERFRRLLPALLSERQPQEPDSFAARQAESNKNPCSWGEAFDNVGWLETHFPGNRRLQIAIAKVLVTFDNSAPEFSDWTTAIEELQPPIPKPPFKPSMDVMAALSGRQIT
jgi:hypothetical protein